MIKALIILAVIYIPYRLYKRIFQEKRCSACGKHIKKQAPICHHCNTVQSDGVVIEVGNSDQIKQPATLANLLRSPLAIVLLVLGQVVIVAVIYILLVR